MFLQIVHHIADVIANFSAGAAISTAAVVLEFILRAIPSQKPLSIAYMIADAAHALADMLGKFGDALDKVLPNRIKQ